MSMKQLLVLILLLFSVRLVLSQTPQEKSVLEIISEADTKSDPAEMVVTLKKALGILEDTGDSIKGIYYYNLGVSYGMRYDVDSATQSLNLSIEYADLAGDIFTQIGSLNGLANVARIENDNDAAKGYYERGLELTKDSKEHRAYKWRSALLGNIAGIFFDLGNPDAALSYTKDALIESTAISDSTSMARNLVQLGYCYNALNYPDSAFQVNQRATEILEMTKDLYLLTFQYYTMGNTYMDDGDFTKAEYYYNECIKLAKQFNEYETLIECLNAMAGLLFEQEKFISAEQYLEESLVVSGKEEILAPRRDAFKLFYELEMARTNYKNAIGHLKEYHLIKDSLSNQETINNIEEFRVKYETAEKEKEILQANAEIAEQERFQVFLIIITSVVILFSAVAIGLIIQRSRLKNALLSQEIDTLRLQINSVFNNQTEEVVLNPEMINEGLFKPLSDREIEIFQQALSDKTNRQIADAMYVSINTVKYHLKNIYEKLGVSNRSEALNKVLAKG